MKKIKQPLKKNITTVASELSISPKQDGEGHSDYDTKLKARVLPPPLVPPKGEDESYSDYVQRIEDIIKKRSGK